MAISERMVRNKRNTVGELTGKSGVVYDVNIKYLTNGKYKTHSKKGFSTKKDALQYEADMKNKLSSACYTPPTAAQSKQPVWEYMEEWIERHGSVNLRPSTKSSYQSHIRNHIRPYIGDIPLGRVTPAILDDMFRQLWEKGLSNSSVKYAHRIVGVAFEHARKYNYIEKNPARDVITKFGKQGKTPDPYTVDQTRHLIANITGTQWEMIIILGGLYGLRLSEILGLRRRNVNLKDKSFSVVEQLPFRLPAGTTIVEEMAPVKSSERVLPITEATLPYFERYLALQQEQKSLFAKSGQTYYDSDLMIAKPDGTPERRDRISSNFGQLLRRFNMPHIRFHDLRHTAATNMHEMTGDFYTVGQILGHSLKGVGVQLGISGNLDSVTAQYVDVRLDRKKIVLSTYHEAVLGSTDE